MGLWIFNGFLVNICIFTVHFGALELLLSSVLGFSFPSPPPCDPGSAKISLLALFSHRLEFLLSLFLPPVFLIENNISLPHLGSSEPQHCTQNSCKQGNFLFAAEIYRLWFFLKSRCLLRNSHLYLSATNKQQCGIQKLIFLKILFNPFPTKEKKSPSGSLVRSQKSEFSLHGRIQQRLH